MSSINNSLQFIATATYETLLQLGIVTKLEGQHIISDKTSSNGNVIQLSLNSLTPITKTIQIITVEITKDSKYMVTLCDENDTTLSSHLFNLTTDFPLLNVIKPPLEWSHFQNEYKEESNKIINTIITGLNLHAKPTPVAKLDPTKTTHPNDMEMKPAPRSAPLPPDPLLAISSSNKEGKHDGVDLPKFEDEYEINEPSKLGSQPGINFSSGTSGYGDQDLFPMGNRDPLGPNLGPFGPQRPGTSNNDSGQLPTSGQGGMIFDPFGQNRDQTFRDGQDKRGPGWIPGSKYDDPFGGSGSNSGPGFPGSGFGFM